MESTFFMCLACAAGNRRSPAVLEAKAELFDRIELYSLSLSSGLKD